MLCTRLARLRGFHAKRDTFRCTIYLSDGESMSPSYLEGRRRRLRMALVCVRLGMAKFASSNFFCPGSPAVDTVLCRVGGGSSSSFCLLSEWRDALELPSCSVCKRVRSGSGSGAFPLKAVSVNAQRWSETVLSFFSCKDNRVAHIFFKKKIKVSARFVCFAALIVQGHGCSTQTVTPHIHSTYST